MIRTIEDLQRIFKPKRRLWGRKIKYTKISKETERKIIAEAAMALIKKESQYPSEKLRSKRFIG